MPWAKGEGWCPVLVVFVLPTAMPNEGQWWRGCPAGHCSCRHDTSLVLQFLQPNSVSSSSMHSFGLRSVVS